jgi:hypothetical protein
VPVKLPAPVAVAACGLVVGMLIALVFMLSQALHQRQPADRAAPHHLLQADRSARVSRDSDAGWPGARDASTALREPGYQLRRNLGADGH